MSIIRAIKHRLGLSVTPANNFVLDASADNGTMKLSRESGQDIMTVDAAGSVAFPQIAKLFSGNGYFKFPNGLIIQWGIGSLGVGQADINFPIAFPNSVFATFINPTQDTNGATGSGLSCSAISTSILRMWNRWQVSVSVCWVAIGY